MNPEEYRLLRACEDTHWWFVSLHRYLESILRQKNLSGAKVLDIGCGTGRWLEQLRSMECEVYGIDMAESAIEFCTQRGFSNLKVGSANQLPYEDASFDLVTCIDVLECESVIPESLIIETKRVLRPGGYALFQMAAHQWLHSEHDLAVHSVRRYSLDEFKCMLSPFFQIAYAGYLFFSLFPLIALKKLMCASEGKQISEGAVSHVKPTHPMVNRILNAVCKYEASLIPGVVLPMGSSVVALCRNV